MRDVIVFLIVMGSLPLSFRRPFIGMLVFSWLAYMRPQDLCWGFARDMRFSFYAAFAMFFGFLAYERGQRKFMKFSGRMLLMAMLLTLTTVSLFLAEKVNDYVLRYYIEFLKIFLIAFFTTGQVDTKERLRLLLWTVCISLGFFGVKGGIFGILTGGSAITRGPGGMLEDNNDFALGMVMNLPLLWYLSRQEKARWIKKACVAATGLTLITILLTHSRGGFLAACGSLLVIAYRSGSFFRALFGLGGLAAAFFLLAPKDVVDRIASIQEGGKERSANARLVAWTIARRMIVANPVLGVGLRNFQYHWDRHAGDIEGARGGFAYVAHNSYLQIWAEAGTPAFIIYMMLLLSVFVTGYQVRLLTRGRDDLEWARVYANLFETVTFGFMIGAFFLNRGHFDLTYHLLAMVSSLLWIVRFELGRDPTTLKTKGGRVLKVRWGRVGGEQARLPSWGTVR